MVVFAGHIEEAQSHVTVLAWETITDQQVKLREFVARPIDIPEGDMRIIKEVFAVLLQVPVKLRAREKAGRMIEEREERELVEVGFLGAVGAGEASDRHFDKRRPKLGTGKTIAQAEGPFVGNDLVERHAGGVFEEVEFLGSRGHAGGRKRSDELGLA